MTARLNKEALNTLCRSPADEWPEMDKASQCVITQAVLCRGPDPAGATALTQYFGPPHLPGTTSIGYRQRGPEIFQDTTESARESYPHWVQLEMWSANEPAFPLHRAFGFSAIEETEIAAGRYV